MALFNMDKFELDFYGALYRQDCLDVQALDRRICYNGRALRVIMTNSVITSVIDLHSKKAIFSREVQNEKY